jgi:hypothetical protein
LGLGLRITGALVGFALTVLILVDCFEGILQPRRVTHRFRYARAFYRSTWILWRATALRIRSGKWREGFLSVFGPLSLISLFVTWVGGLILGFALIQWGCRTALHGPDEATSFGTYLYLSGTTFFTLGYGDVTPAGALGRTLAVMESGLGFGFLAVIITYLPVLSQAFSKRETVISVLDARAGSPPSAGQFLLRIARSGNLAMIDPALAEWERWAAELLESHLSYPALSYYRSQHDNQSWLATLTTTLDICSILLAAVKDFNKYQAQLTFAMARHAAVDLALILRTPPLVCDPPRVSEADLKRLWEALAQAGLKVSSEAETDAKLAELRGMYEPFINGLARQFLFALPPLIAEDSVADNWQRSAWMARLPGIVSLSQPDRDNLHF